jgi:hypothetical protein
LLEKGIIGKCSKCLIKNTRNHSKIPDSQNTLKSQSILNENFPQTPIIQKTLSTLNKIKINRNENNT